MEIGVPNTKTVLVLAAGELFAEHGFDGVSTRMIAEKAGTNLGGIHYHFGSKEALYVEAFRYACRKEERVNPSHIIDEHPELAESPEGLAEAVQTACRRLFKEFFRPDKPQWQVRLIARELATPSPAMPVLVEEIFAADMAEGLAFYRLIRPDASDDEAMVWSNLIRAQAVFHLLAKAPLELIRNGKPLGEPFLEELVRATSLALITLAGLPVPASLAAPATAKPRSRT